MNREQQILFILKEASKPIKARKIAKMFEIEELTEEIKKKDVEISEFQFHVRKRRFS